MKTITDKYGEVVNASETYTCIAKILEKNLPVLIGWTDEEGTHLDILFVYGVTQFGSQIQRGLKPNYLFVSIMGVGAHGFQIEDGDTHHGYISEKFSNWFGSSSTGKKFAKLVNEIKKELVNLHGNNRIYGNASNISGNASNISGNASNISGNVSDIRGYVSDIRGYVSDIRGNVSGMSGDIGRCLLTEEDRNIGVKIEDLIE